MVWSVQTRGVWFEGRETGLKNVVYLASIDTVRVAVRDAAGCSVGCSVISNVLDENTLLASYCRVMPVAGAIEANNGTLLLIGISLGFAFRFVDLVSTSN